jgi:hypothetical protein
MRASHQQQIEERSSSQQQQSAVHCPSSKLLSSLPIDRQT